MKAVSLIAICLVALAIVGGYVGTALGCVPSGNDEPHSPKPVLSVPSGNDEPHCPQPVLSICAGNDEPH